MTSDHAASTSCRPTLAIATYAAACLLSSASLLAGTIDFETTPAGPAPDDDAALSTAYVDGATEVRFGFDTTEDLTIDTDAHFEMRGGGGVDSVNAYYTGPTDSGPLDGDFTPGGAGGAWLLRAPGNFGGGVDIKNGDDFLVIYSGALPDSASGQIWDIDGAGPGIFERWRVEAFDSEGEVIATLDSPFFTTKVNPPADSLDAWPWTFSFGDLSVPIRTIRISWTGEIGGFNAGFAFDNFNATAAAADQDADGIEDMLDNCLLAANADQRDTDGDGFGNVCDADLDQDCSVNFLDLALMKAAFFTSDANADLDGDGAVNFTDLGLMKAGFFQPPGPSGVPNLCD